MKRKTIKKSELAPNCKHCGCPVRAIARKGMPTVFVELHPIWFVPRDDGVAVVDSKGKYRRGEISTDGIKGYKEHQCLNTAKTRYKIQQ